jgi:hypothetical protein
MSGPTTPREQGLLEEQVAELLQASGLEDVIARSRQIAVLTEITRQRTAVDEGDEGARWRLAQALERLAQTVRDANGRRRLFDEAFVCRRAIAVDALGLMERLIHLLCLTADALAADRRAELIMLLRSVPPQTLDIPPDIEWA